VKEIRLHGAKAAGRVALVDDEDYDLVMAYRWRVWEVDRGRRRLDGPYAVAHARRAGRPTGVRMHQLITGWSRTDHRNGDGLDNRRGNLRPATNAQNQHNQRPQLGGSSAYKGVYRQRGKWRAQISVDDRRRYLGVFADEVDAARAYDEAARALFGEFARVNFPAGPPEPLTLF
jgi:hypothetical protein